MFVIARSTAFSYRGKPADSKQIGRELGVRYLLEGSVQTLGTRLRITAQLIDGETNAYLRANDCFSDREGGAKSPVDLPLRLDVASASPTTPQGQHH
jgi:TolB-like protein